jgi:hypothetical protein
LNPHLGKRRHVHGSTFVIVFVDEMEEHGGDEWEELCKKAAVLSHM